MKYLFTLFTLLCTASTILHAQQPGTLDKTFGDGGVVISSNCYGDCKDLLVQKDGKIISIGSGTYGNLTGGFLLVRYNTDGTPDLSFGDSGRVVTSRGTYYAYGALQEDGKIIAAGGATPTVIRYNTDGTIDSSFGTNGIVIQKLKSDYEIPTGLAIQPDGKILISGTDEANEEIHGAFQAIYIIRYNTDGSLDESFGNGGIMEQQLYNPIITAGIAVQPDGCILVGGGYYITGGTPFFVKRYTKDGTPDTKFGVNGEARFTFAGGGANIYAIILRADGSIVAAGSRYGILGDGNPQAILVGFTADGKVDNEFGTGGVATTQVGKYGSEIYDLALQPDGKIVAAATSVDIYKIGSIAYAAVRYQSSGALDSSFGQNGIQVTNIQEQPYSDAIVLQKDGKIVLGGYSIAPNGYGYVTLVRYNGDNNKQSPIVRIKRWLQHHGISWQSVQGSNNIRYYTVQRSADGIVYKDIAKVSSKVNNYEDAAMPAADSYYRIAATGWDGRRTYSNTILIDDAQQARIFPNPVRDNLQLQGLPAIGKTNVSVVDLNGNVRSNATATGTNYSVSTANLSSGSYLLKIQHGGIATTLPFVKE